MEASRPFSLLFFFFLMLYDAYQVVSKCRTELRASEASGINGAQIECEREAAAAPAVNFAY